MICDDNAFFSACLESNRTHWGCIYLESLSYTRKGADGSYGRILQHEVNTDFSLFDAVFLSSYILICGISISWTCAQSKEQQLFNNRLVRIVYHTATINGYIFDPEIYSGGEIPLTQRSKKNDSIHQTDSATLTPLPVNFNWKKLRDKIRCYYKTNVQNSKKRLATMLKNPSKARNKNALMRAIDLIQDEPYLKISSAENQPKSTYHKAAPVVEGTRPLPDGKPGVGADHSAVLKPENLAAPTRKRKSGNLGTETKNEDPIEIALNTNTVDHSVVDSRVTEKF